MRRCKLGYVLVAISIPLLALAVLVYAVQTVSAAPPAVTLEQCANGGSNETDYCRLDPGGETGWVTGNSNAQKSTYWIDQFIVYRFIFTDLAPEAIYCGGHSFDIAHQGKPAIDYLGTFSETMYKADPVIGTDFVGQRLTPDDVLPIPLDPQLQIMTMDGASFTGTQKPGRIQLWGAEFVPSPVSPTLPVLRYGNIGQFSDYTDPDDANQQSLEYCVQTLPGQTQAVVSWSGHIADPEDWKPLIRPSGSPYHMRYGTTHISTPPRTAEGQFWGSDGTDRNFGNIEVQLDIANNPTAITLRNMSAEGQSAGIYLALFGAGVLALFTGGLLVWRQRQVMQSPPE